MNHPSGRPQSDVSIKVTARFPPWVLVTPAVPPHGASLGDYFSSNAAKDFPFTGAYCPCWSSDFALLYLAFAPLDCSPAAAPGGTPSFCPLGLSCSARHTGVTHSRPRLPGTEPINQGGRGVTTLLSRPRNTTDGSPAQGQNCGARTRCSSGGCGLPRPKASFGFLGCKHQQAPFQLINPWVLLPSPEHWPPGSGYQL